MRVKLLESLICPVCKNGAWRLEHRRPLFGEVVGEGLLVCAGCGAQYAIHKGIVDLLPQPDDVVLRERTGWRKFLDDASEETELHWLLALPRIGEGVTSRPESIAHWKRQADNFENLMRHLNLSGRERVLELGAGRCWASAYLARRGCQVVALDVVSDVRAGGLETGQLYIDHGTPHFERVVSIMEVLPFKEQTFDVVLSVASIHHTSSLEQVVAECGRVLGPGGRLALTSEPCIRVLKERRVDNVETRLGINEHVYNILDYRTAFRKAGLEASFFLPGALVAMLGEEELTTETTGLKARLFELARRGWRSEGIRRLLSSRMATSFGLLFLEYGLTAIVRKKGAGESQ